MGDFCKVRDADIAEIDDLMVKFPQRGQDLQFAARADPFRNRAVSRRPAAEYQLICNACFISAMMSGSHWPDESPIPQANLERRSSLETDGIEAFGVLSAKQGAGTYQFFCGYLYLPCLYRRDGDLCP
jgi:hypothetical protein